MSPNDQFFLKSLGIKPEEVSPADKAPGYTAVFEPCKACSRRRHRNLSTGEVFCLSCRAREMRKGARPAVEYARALASAALATAPTDYKGFTVTRVEGQGWCYCLPGHVTLGMWHSADSLQDAMQKIDRLAPPESREPDEFLVENACRGCNAPCGNHRWCKSCGRDKFGNG